MEAVNNIQSNKKDYSGVATGGLIMAVFALEELNDKNETLKIIKSCLEMLPPELVQRSHLELMEAFKPE